MCITTWAVLIYEISTAKERHLKSARVGCWNRNGGVGERVGVVGVSGIPLLKLLCFCTTQHSVTYHPFLLPPQGWGEFLTQTSHYQSHQIKTDINTHNLPVVSEPGSDTSGLRDRLHAKWSVLVTRVQRSVLIRICASRYSKVCLPGPRECWCAHICKKASNIWLRVSFPKRFFLGLSQGERLLRIKKNRIWRWMFSTVSQVAAKIRAG